MLVKNRIKLYTSYKLQDNNSFKGDGLDGWMSTYSKAALSNLLNIVSKVMDK